MGVFMILKGANAEEGSYTLFFKDVHVEQPKTDSGLDNPRAMKVGWHQSVNNNSHVGLSGEYAMDDLDMKTDFKAQASIELMF